MELRRDKAAAAPAISLVVREIRDLYVRTCACADRYNGVAMAEAESLKQAFRGQPDPRYPELNCFGDVFERAAALKQATNEPRLRMQRGAVYGGLWLVLVAATWYAMVWNGSMWMLYVALGLLLAPTLWVEATVCRRSVRQSLRRQLVARGVPVCVPCGYDLRGRASDRCPECGAAVPAALGATSQEQQSNVIAAAS